MTKPTEIRIRRASGDGYAASGGGQRATCAWSPMEAARRCADKLAGQDRHRLERLEAQPGDREKGVLYRFKVVPLGGDTAGKGHGPKDPPRPPGYRPYA